MVSGRPRFLWLSGGGGGGMKGKEKLENDKRVGLGSITLKNYVQILVIL